MIFPSEREREQERRRITNLINVTIINNHSKMDIFKDGEKAEK